MFGALLCFALHISPCVEHKRIRKTLPTFCNVLCLVALLEHQGKLVQHVVKHSHACVCFPKGPQ